MQGVTREVRTESLIWTGSSAKTEKFEPRGGGKKVVIGSKGGRACADPREKKTKPTKKD